MNNPVLFTDGSVNTKTNVGFGAYLLLEEEHLLNENINQKVKLKRFENTSSTKLEVETLLWALSEIAGFEGKLKIYTDSQNIVGLPGRRSRLEKNNYCAKSGRPINNGDLYRVFFQTTDRINCEIVKIKGHKRTRLKSNIDKLFSIVDRASRNAVREENHSYE
jgi:ribonuclease HI